MNLESQIRPELWAAISHSYESENYTHAIKDAMSFVTDILRDKTGLDGDGKELVGKALGFSAGKPPKLQINKLQTETERNIQIGLQEVLRGMYSLIRNPRNHERLSDTRNSADAIILFVDYLLTFLGELQQSFTIQGFLAFVTDRYFVPDKEYVDELVQKIPVRKRVDTLVAIYREKTWEFSDNLRLTISAILDKLAEPEISEFLAVVSDELLYTDKDTDVSLILKLLPSHLWPRLEKMPRLRVEGMLTESISSAWYFPDKRKTNHPVATWAPNVTKYFLRKKKLGAVLMKKLRSEDFDHHNFVGQFMMSTLEDIFTEEKEIEACVDAISTSLERGNEFLKNKLCSFMTRQSSSLWRDAFVERLLPLTDPDNPEIFLEDGRPFLGKFVAQDNPAGEMIEEDDIPF